MEASDYLSDKISTLFQRSRAEESSKYQDLTKTYVGVVTKDSSNGRVSVILDGNGTDILLPTTVDAKVGDSVIITSTVNNGLDTLAVTGVVGGGDRTRIDVDNAVSDASQAADAAGKAADAANAAKQSAEEARTKAEEATTSAAEAKTKAEEATASATEARKKANEAISSASGAASAAQTAQDAAEAVEEQLSNKNRTFYAPTAPASTSDYTLVDGDRWVDTDDLTEYIWSSSKWNRINDTHTYFWHDKNGAHVRNQDQGYQVNVGSDGVEVQRLSDGEILARYSGSGIGYSEDVPYRIGSSSSYMKYDPKTKQLTISADSVLIGSSTVSSIVNKASSDASQAVDTAGKAADTANTAKQNADKAIAETKDLVTLRIDSSRGTVFKNSEVSTVLTVRCYKRGQELTTLTALRQAMLDATARIRWYVLREGDTDWVSLADSDPMLSNDGFTLTVKPDDVTVKCTFKAEIVTD